MAPVARYAKSGDLHIAYAVEGDGPVDLLWIPPWISQVEYLWAEPSLERVMARLTQFARVITFDRRGSGLSDPLFGAPTLEDQMDDVLAVMEAAGSERATICGTLEGGPMAALFAASHPQKTEALVLYATFARATWAPGYEWAWPAELRDEKMGELIDQWGQGYVASAVAPSQMADPGFMEWAGRLERLAASPSTIRRIIKLIGEFDVRDVLPSIRVPTLVMHRTDDTFIKVEHSRYIASQIPGARYVELEGDENMFSVGDWESLVGELEEFMTGTRHEREPDRMLATVLFTDICESTQRAAEMGDRGWRFLLERHDALFRQALSRHRGREVKRTGDGFLATFDGPARAIRCAASVTEAMGSLGLQIRAGLHTGELEVMDGDLGGLAVHIASRVMGAAAPNEVLVSGTVKDLVVGSGIDFEDRGERELRGVPGEWRLYAVN
ncbi:MAG TPA: alpha/beta fold hydrolase [Thermoleophilaceae bacterium]|nr:alpha/beta fold hydrolase [Thermoleophilaceae bacterium]